MGLGIFTKLINDLLDIVFSDYIIQRNTKGYGSDFARDWVDYKNGFGSISGKTYWRGLDEIHDLTKTGTYSLEVVLKQNGQTKTLRWSSFSVDTESNYYRLSISGYNAGSSGLPDNMNYHNGQVFSTRDRCHSCPNSGCANSDGNAGWWFGSCYHCHLNRGDSAGPQYSGSYDESTMILKR